MNHNNREECGMMSPLLWILCKLAAENRAQELELDECYARIDKLTADCDKFYSALKQKEEAAE